MNAGPQSTETPPPSRSLWKECISAYLFTVVVIVGLTALSSINAFVLEITQALVAFLFIGLPWWILSKKGISFESLGIHSIPILREVRLALGVCLLVFPLFIIGNHLFQTQIQDRSLDMGVHWVDRWTHDIQGRPDTLSEETPFTIWDERGTWTVLWSAPNKGENVEISIKMEGDTLQDLRSVFVENGELILGRQCVLLRTKPDEKTLQTTSHCAGGIRFTTGDASHLQVSLVRGSDPVESHDIRLGEFAMESDDASPLDYNRSIWWGLWWILELLLIHIVLVGIPEEMFYRGYLQSRLQQIMPPRWRIFGVSWGPALIVTSVFFALGHFAVGLNPERLLVFFPSLLFGLVRNWTGSIGAAALFHALCNVLQQVILRMYV